MRKSLLLAVWPVLLVGLLVSACATADTAPSAQPRLTGPRAQIHLQRPSEFVSGAVAARIHIDGRHVANLSAGGSTVLDVPPGAHKISIDSWSHSNTYTMPLHAKAGMRYTVEVSARTEPVVAGALFGMVGMMIESAANENGGAFQARLVETTSLR